MRLAGKSGEEIIAALAANSATFGTKTEFSQEKYKKRKAKKYLVTACVRRPTAASVCQAYYDKQPGKIGFLRLDTLSLLLSLANIGAHARVLVIDACGGLVTAAVAERLGGFGSVTAAHVGPRPPGSEALRQFNFSAQLRSTVRTVSLQQLLAEAATAGQAGAATTTPQGDAGQQGDPQQQEQQQRQQQQGDVGGAADSAEHEGAEAGAAAESGAVEMQVDAPQPAALPTELQQPMPAAVTAVMAAASNSPGPDKTDDMGHPTEATAGVALEPQAQECQQQQKQQQQQLQPYLPFTCCIVAAPALSPSAALAAVLPLLAPSAPFAVYHQWQQPLAEAMAELQKERRALGLTLQESWWRDYQVLPARTHALMQMNHGGGYLLSGTTVKREVEADSGAPAAAAQPQGQKPAASKGQANRKRKGR
ncbi:hypothetical protein N2152v2_002116 [Parachlorella kessleri]